MSAKSIEDRDALALSGRIRVAAAETENIRLSGFCRQFHDTQTILDDRIVGFISAVPFQHREFGSVQISALAIAIDRPERVNPAFARGEQLLGGELRRRVQIKPLPRAVEADQLGRESMKMGLVSGRDLQACAFDFDEALALEVI